MVRNVGFVNLTYVTKMEIIRITKVFESTACQSIHLYHACGLCSILKFTGKGTLLIMYVCC
jgi:hypothetical protein